jgi:hypothetical protein
MTTSSVPLDYSTISTINTGDTITITSLPDSMYSYNNMSTGFSGVSLSNSISTLSISTGTYDMLETYTVSLPEDWVNQFPNWDRVKNMCKQYPSLEIALRNFETIYQLVKDDYDNPSPKK